MREVFKLTAWILVFATGIMVSGCKTTGSTAATDSKKEITRAKVILAPTQGNHTKGVVSFIQEANGVRIIADVEGLSPGQHGFHIHEFGDCSAPDGSSAGGHYNPTNSKHGAPTDKERHVGDLGNVMADANGKAHEERIDTVIKLNGDTSIIGRSIIIHAAPDDFVTQPAGNAGGRVACGVIMIEK